MALGHKDCIPQNVTLDTLVRSLEPLPQEEVKVNVFFKPPDKPLYNPDGTPKIDKNGEQEFREITPKYRDHIATFPNRDAFDAWIEAQAKGTVGTKGALGITALSSHGRRLEKQFVCTNRLYLDSDKSDIGAFQRILSLLAPTGMRFSLHESSGSVRRRTQGIISPDSPPVKWHLDLALSQSLFNPLNEVYPVGETEQQTKQREAFMPKNEVEGIRHRGLHLRREWKRKQHFLIRWFSDLAQLVNSETGEPGFDLSVHQMCQFRYVGVKYAANGPDPVIWNSRGPLALNFEKFLQLAGYEPEVYKPWQPPAPKIVRVSKADGSVDVYQRLGGYEDLDALIRDRIPMREFMDTFVHISSDGSNSDGSTSWTCPLPGHPDPHPRTLTTGPSDNWSGDYFNCLGDCRTGGPVSKFAMLFWQVSYHEARLRLAKHLGLNPKDYRGRLERIDSEFKEASEVDQAARVKLTAPAPVPVPGPELAPALVVPPKTSAAKKVLKKSQVKKAKRKGLKNVTIWIEKHHERFKDQNNLFLALTKVILLLQQEKLDLEAVTATLWWRFAHLFDGDFGAMLFEVASTTDRIRANKPAYGVGFLKKSVGTSELFDLASAFRRDGIGYKTAFKYLIGIARTEGLDRGFLESQWLEHSIDPGRMANPQEKGSDAYTKHEKRRETFQRALRRPGACGQCGQRTTGEGGRALGPPGEDGKPTHLERRIVCVSKICMYCMVLLSISEAEILEDMWKDKVSKKKPVWIVQGTIEKVSYVAEVKEKLSRLRDAKLTILGWGSDYKPQLTVFVNTPEAAMSVTSVLAIGQLMAASRVGNESNAPEAKSWRVTDSSKAVGIALEARLSFNIHGKRLVEEQKEDDLADWLWWAIGKTPVRNPRKEEALHWPTKDQVLAQVKANKGESWEPDLWPGEVASFELFHYKTRFVFARRKKIPYGIDDAAVLMKTNMSFRHVESMRVAEERRAKGLKAAIDLDNHRMPLRGAVAVSA